MQQAGNGGEVVCSPRQRKILIKKSNCEVDKEVISKSPEQPVADLGNSKVHNAETFQEILNSQVLLPI